MKNREEVEPRKGKETHFHFFAFFLALSLLAFPPFLFLFRMILFGTLKVSLSVLSLFSN